MISSEKYTVFIGAGASVFAGYRTFSSFPDLLFNYRFGVNKKLEPEERDILYLLREIHSLLRSLERPTTHDQFLFVLTEYAELWRTLRTDSVLRDRFLSTAHQFSDFGNFYGIVKSTIAEITKETIKHYSENRIKNYNNQIASAANRVFVFYERLAKLNSEKMPFLSVFTTNYDMLFEDLFRDRVGQVNEKFRLINGFNDCSVEQITKDSNNLNCNNEDCEWDLEEFNRFKNVGLHLLRMHGCVCWFELADMPVIIQCKRERASELPQENLRVVMPGFRKPTGTGPQGFAFERFYNTLINCNVLLIIGFSFQDDDVMQLILSALYKRSSPMHIIIVNPSIETEAVLEALEGAQQRSIYPSKLPHKNKIKCLNCEFGFEGFEQIIFTKLDKIIKGGS